MKKKIFISHCSDDKEYVQIIAETLKKISNDKILPWFSSNNRKTEEGITFGKEFYNEIFRNLNESNLCIILLTKNSVKNQWINFEAGYAKGHGIEIMPIYIDVSFNEIGAPLNFIHGCQINSKQDLLKYFTIVVNYLKLELNEEKAIDFCLNEIIKITQQRQLKTNNRKFDIEKALEELTFCVNKRFSEIINNKVINEYEPYTIKVENNFFENGLTYNIEIKSTDTVQDILNKIYFTLGGSIEAYTYLKKWILKNKRTEANLVIYEVSTMIPAHNIFIPDDIWEIHKLSEPYTSYKPHCLKD